MAHLVEHPTLDFGPGHDLTVMRSSPALGSLLEILSLPLSLPLPTCPCPLSVSLSKKKKKKEGKKKDTNHKGNTFMVLCYIY